MFDMPYNQTKSSVKDVQDLPVSVDTPHKNKLMTNFYINHYTK